MVYDFFFFLLGCFRRLLDCLQKINFKLIVERKSKNHSEWLKLGICFEGDLLDIIVSGPNLEAFIGWQMHHLILRSQHDLKKKYRSEKWKWF